MEDESSMLFPQSQIVIHPQPLSAIKEPMDEEVQPPQLKALNPHQKFKDYPTQLKMNLINSSFKKKYFAGIQTLLGVSSSRDQSNQFLETIDATVFENSDESNLINCNHLFEENQFPNHQHQNISHQLNLLKQKFEEIQKKTFAGLCINKTIGIAFMQHFQNFLYLKEQSNILKKFEQNLKNFYEEAKKIKTAGAGLILLTYEFWMKMFREFVRQIWKHSQKYTLNQLKVNQNHDKQKKFQTWSTNSSQISNEKDKRKPWKKEDVQILQANLKQNCVFTQTRLQQLSIQLGRTPCSISSKIQKLTKKKKKQDNFQGKFEDGSIEQKIIFVLKNNQQGLSKQEIISMMMQMYQMEEEQSWKKSVGTILSSSKSIERIKANFTLQNPQQYYKHSPSTSMKDKIIQCFLEFPNHCGDLKTIVKAYLENFTFIEDETYDQNRKQLQISISKVLTRYSGIFEKDKNKTIYRLCQEKRLQLSQMFVQNFF